ncbi:MAG: EscJ/YscJ/HrcJ family type III secretion inner membrane ring protein [Chlamydiae bacterium]|nr:EscJ/YscJ/HrcJ family type III secretion inner membrane ring protein [Chlamydiota bacterium]
MKFRSILCFILALFLTSCSETQSIISSVDERQANIILVFLESKGIHAVKEASSSGAAMGAEQAVQKYNILVDKKQSIEAMALLNQNGLPQRQGTSLLELFAKQGLMSTDKEETIRYQAGLAQQIANTILMIDGVIDASVQLSFPVESALGTTNQERITAAVYVKHQGIFDDPNSHLESKIKRLVAGSVNGLSIDDVTVVSDKSRFTDISTSPQIENLAGPSKEYVRIWSMIMSKESASKFRSLFFTILMVAFVMFILLGWIIWKVYPILRANGGAKELLSPIPLLKKKKQGEVLEE